jgi:hypothetical protein
VVPEEILGFMRFFFVCGDNDETRGGDRTATSAVSRADLCPTLVAESERCHRFEAVVRFRSFLIKQ